MDPNLISKNFVFSQNLKIWREKISFLAKEKECIIDESIGVESTFVFLVNLALVHFYSIYYTRFSEEAEKYKNEVVRLKENLNDERREKEALQEIVDKENEKEGEVEFDVIKQHPAFIRLVHALKQCKKQADEFKSENEGLKEQMDKMNVVNGLEGKKLKLFEA